MQTLTREQLKILFKKVKKLRLPDDLENVDFENLKYYSWLDETDRTLYIVYKYKEILTGIAWDAQRMSLGNSAKGGLCDICRKHHKLNKIVLITAKTKKRPKGVDYRTRGKYVCLNCFSCNEKLESTEELDKLYEMILEKE